MQGAWGGARCVDRLYEVLGVGDIRQGKKEKLVAEVGVSSPGCVAILLTSGRIIIEIT